MPPRLHAPRLHAHRLHAHSLTPVTFPHPPHLNVTAARQVNYGVLPVAVDGRDRHVFFTYVGSSTSALKRGRASMHSPHMDKFFDGTAGALPTLTTAEELEPSNVNGLLLQLFKGALTAEVQ